MLRNSPPMFSCILFFGPFLPEAGCFHDALSECGRGAVMLGLSLQTEHVPCLMRSSLRLNKWFIDQESINVCYMVNHDSVSQVDAPNAYSANRMDARSSETSRPAYCGVARKEGILPGSLWRPMRNQPEPHGRDRARQMEFDTRNLT